MSCHAAAFSATGMLLIPSAVLAASFMGSLHCVGMCGGLMVAICKKPAQLFSYHLGRLLSYMALGSVFGWLGQALQVQSLPWLGPLTAVVMGMILIGMGFQFLSKGSLHIWLPKPILAFVASRSSKLLRANVQHTSLIIPAAFGLLSVLLPCGWLYSYALAAAALQSPWAGATLMACFWLGGLPALSFAPLFFRKLLQAADPWFPRAISVLLMGLGVWTIVQKFMMPVGDF